MKTQLCFLLLFLISITAIPVCAQGEKKARTDADYRARTLQELTTLQPDYIANNPSYKDAASLRIVVHGDLLPSRVTALYDGTTRPVLESRKGVITAWANRFAGAPEFWTVPYDTEMLFTEAGKSHWLVVRRDALTKFEQELKKGEAVELFLVKLGNAPVDDKMEPVLLVEKFVKP
jgi:hypothetical protein